MRWLDGITRLDGHEFVQTLGDSEGQGTLAMGTPCDHGVARSQTQLSN